MSLKKKSRKALLWQLFGLFLSVLVSVGSLMITARLLPPASFGIFALVGLLVAVATVCAMLGYDQALIQLKSVGSNHINFAFFACILQAVVVSGSLYYFAGGLSSIVDGRLSASHIQAAALIILLTSFGFVSKSLLVRDLEFDRLVFCTVIPSIVGTLIVAGLLAFYGYDEWSLIIGLITSSFCSSVLYLYLKPIQLTYRSSISDSREIFMFGAKMTGAILLARLAISADKIVIGKVATVDALGLYERAYRIQKLLSVYIERLSTQLLFSTLSKTQDKADVAVTIFLSGSALLSFFSIYGVAFMFYFSAEIVNALLGDGWSQAIPLLKYLSFILFLDILVLVGNNYIRSRGLFRELYGIRLAFLVSVVIFASVAFLYYGLVGAVVGVVLANLIHALLVFAVSARSLNISSIQVLYAFKPVLLFSVLITAKCLIVSMVFGSQLFQEIGMYFFLDLIILLIYLLYPRLLGSYNLLLVESILGGLRYTKYLKRFMR